MKIHDIFSLTSFKINWILMIIFFIFDFLSKNWVIKNLPLYETRIVFTNFIELLHVQNRGISFSLFSDLPDYIRVPFLVGVSLIAVIVMIYYQTRYWKEIDFYSRIGLVFVIPGATGNLVDRFFYGYVTDFIHFRWYDTSFFVNNLADCFISFGVIFFIAQIFFQKKDTLSKTKN